VIGALGTTALAGSVTVPVMVPRSLCENTGKANDIKQMIPARNRMDLPPEDF
jgi:hypothetical protein